MNNLIAYLGKELFAFMSKINVIVWSTDPGVVPKSRNHAERLALLEQTARSLTSRLNLQRNTFAGAFNARNDDTLKSSVVLERNSMVSVSNAPIINGSFTSHSLNNGRQFEEEAVNDDSDSTLTEESVGQPEKVSLLVKVFTFLHSNFKMETA